MIPKLIQMRDMSLNFPDELKVNRGYQYLFSKLFLRVNNENPQEKWKTQKKNKAFPGQDFNFFLNFTGFQMGKYRKTALSGCFCPEKKASLKFPCRRIVCRKVKLSF